MAMSKRSFFSDDFRLRLESAVADLEAKTSVEIVSVFESRKDYFKKYPHLLFWPPVFFPRFLKPASVNIRARRIFIERGLHRTKQRNALMIFISEAEKAVYLLADEGLEKKVSGDYWDSVGKRLADDFCSENPGDSFFDALCEIAPQLISEFPSSAVNDNEICNKLVE